MQEVTKLKNIEVEKLPQEKPQRKQKVKMQKHRQKMRTQQQQKQNAKMLKRKQKKSEECGSMMNNSVETANEAGGIHRGRPGLHTVKEEVDHIVFHNDHVEYDMNYGTDEGTRTMRNITCANGEQIDIVTENEKTEAVVEGIESTSTESTLKVAVGTEGVTGEEHSDHSTVNEESGCIVGGDYHARCARPVDEAGSIVLYVSNDMSEEKKRR